MENRYIKLKKAFVSLSIIFVVTIIAAGFLLIRGGGIRQSTYKAGTER